MTKWQKIKVRDYGDDWLNRLAAILKVTEKMDKQERDAMLNFVIRRYRPRVIEAKSQARGYQRG